MMKDQLWWMFESEMGIRENQGDRKTSEEGFEVTRSDLSRGMEEIE